MFDKQYSDKCLILRLSMPFTCRYVYCLHKLSFDFLMNRSAKVTINR